MIFFEFYGNRNRGGNFGGTFTADLQTPETGNESAGVITDTRSLLHSAAAPGAEHLRPVIVLAEITICNKIPGRSWSCFEFDLPETVEIMVVFVDKNRPGIGDRLAFFVLIA